MKLNYKTICDITYGAEKITEEDGFFVFQRFTDDELNLYKEDGFRAYMYERIFSTAGIRFSFMTDSEKLKISCDTIMATSGFYAYFDLYENGVLVNHLGTDNINNHVVCDFPLSKGTKHIEVYFPWSVNTKISSVEVDDNSFITPVSRAKKMVNYGDSITHGYFCKHSSLSYAAQIARTMDADSINKAVGGDVFFPELVNASKNEDADIVTIAYGTNDWGACKYDEFIKNCKNFMHNIVNKHQSAEIYVITPIWRGDSDAQANTEIPHTQIGEEIEKICAEYKNITVIDGYKLVPHAINFFEDLRLHPNDLGFSQYAINLHKEIVNAKKEKIS